MSATISSRLSALALLGASALALTSAPSYAYSTLYVFGDSLSDVGNVYAATGGAIPAPPYDGGRFSNGPIWAEYLAAAMKLGPLTPSLLKGNDYAFGYATASDAIPKLDPTIPSTPSVVQQVGAYVGDHGAKADPSALYAVWIGANDVLNALGGLASGKLSLQDALIGLTISAQTEVAALKALVTLGAQHLLVGLVPDIGLTPRLNTNPVASGGGTLLSAFYNQQLVAAAKHDVPTNDLALFDPFTLLDKAVADPAAYNFTNVTTACFGGSFTSGGSACTDPEDYLFWDSIHPTTAGHAAIAALALQTVSPVPLPASAPMFGAALVVLGVFTAFRRHAAKRAP